MEFINSTQKLKIEKDGNIKEYDILFTFNSSLDNRLYIGYTDNSIGNNGRKNIFVSSYDTVKKDNNYGAITNIDELTLINKALEKIDMEVQGGSL